MSVSNLRKDYDCDDTDRREQCGPYDRHELNETDKFMIFFLTHFFYEITNLSVHFLRDKTTSNIDKLKYL